VKKTLRRLLTGAVAALALSVGVAVHAAPAEAQTRPIAIVSNAHIRPSPDTSQNWLTTMPAGSHPQYHCYADGENEQGTTKWFRVTWNGITGYYSSVADDVPLSLQNNIEGNYGIPRCGSGADLQPAGGGGLQPAGGAGINQGSDADLTVSPAPTIYNRAASKTWALQNAQAVRADRFADCTWLVSQALWYGGFRQTVDWNMHDHHGFPLWPIKGTVTATAAPDLVNYLLNHGLAEKIPLGDKFATNAVPQAQIGDVIAYTWDSAHSNVIDHLALVTNIAPGQYPEVSEWGTVPVREPYAKRGWTWSALSGKWLQQVCPGVTAVLIHFTVPSY